MSGYPRLVTDFATSAERLLTQVRHWEQPRWSVPTGQGTRADQMYALVQCLAEFEPDVAATDDDRTVLAGLELLDAPSQLDAVVQRLNTVHTLGIDVRQVGTDRRRAGCDDELVEVTPDKIRLRKIMLAEADRRRAARQAVAARR